MPAFLELQLVRSALRKPVDEIRDPGDAPPGDLHLAEDRPDVGEHHVEGEQRADAGDGGDVF